MIDVETHVAQATVELGQIPVEISMDDERFTFVLPTQNTGS